MTVLQTRDDDMRRMLNDVETYWRDLSRARRLPMRSQVDPAAIDQAMPQTFIMQRVAPGVARIRVSGQWVNDMLGLDGRGMPLCSLMQPASRAEFARLLDAVFTWPAVVEVPLVSSGGFLQAKLSARLLMLPLLDDHGVANRAIGVFATATPDRVKARRFGLGDGALRCDRISPAPRPRLIVQQKDATLRQIMQAGSNGTEKGPHAVRRPALELVVDNVR